MAYSFAEHLLLRLPFYPAGAFTTAPQDVLNDLAFRSAIYLASPVFYKRLTDASFSWGHLSQKEQITVIKYFNRCCFRPTPFGLFASVSLASWGKKERIIPASAEPVTGILQPDQRFVDEAAKSLLNRSGTESRFETNPTIYRVLKEYRFISTETDDLGKRNYQLQSTDYSTVLKDLLAFCRRTRTGSEIMRQITVLAHTAREESEDYFRFLSDSQVLVPVERSNITGNNHLAILAAITQKEGFSKDITRKNGLVVNLQSDQLTITHILNYKESLQQRTNPENIRRDGNHIYAVLIRRMLDAKLDEKYQETIRNGLFALNILCPPDELPALKQFRQSFRQHFEGQRIPLLMALDPECGTGYQEIRTEVPNALLETINIYPGSAPDYRSSWTPAHIYLMECWMKAESQNERIIRLEKAGLNKVRHAREDQPTLGYSILFRIAQGKILLESVAGNNPLALVGRFTAADEEIAAAVRKMALQQETLNPHLIFAELLQLADPHTDNINRRAHIWTYELPITAASTLHPQQQIAMEDLYVELSGDKVYLWSEKHRKYVIPRLTTAYNHRINKLPLFRFLADLPYQYGSASLSFDLRIFFPGLTFYPRVEYGDAILSPAIWILREDIITLFQHCTEKKLSVVFDRIARENKLPEIFALTEGDQQLVFFKDRLKDIRFFREVIRHRKEVILTEFMIDDTDKAVVKSWNGNPFVNQFNAFLLPETALPLPNKPQVFPKSTKTIRKFMPGSEWLYLKIYSPRLGATKLLLKIWPLIKKKYRDSHVTKWFFIRYEDPAPHIRLRLKIDPQHLSEILAAFRTLLEGDIHQQVIREYQLDVYNRELERYQAAGIDLTEDLFWASSLFVMYHLRHSNDKTAAPAFLAAIASVKLIADEILPDHSEQKTFFEKCYRQMMDEFDGTHVRRQLDLKYRELGRLISDTLHDDTFFRAHKMGAAARNLKKRAAFLKDPLLGHEDLRNYVQSVLHMHLNRIFTDQQRQQEMIIYYLIFKHLNAVEASRKHQWI